MSNDEVKAIKRILAEMCFSSRSDNNWWNVIEIESSVHQLVLKANCNFITFSIYLLDGGVSIQYSMCLCVVGIKAHIKVI